MAGNPNFKKYLTTRIDPRNGYASLLSFPRYFEIETVNACNARCPMCTIGDWQRNMPLMRDDAFETIAVEILDHVDSVLRVSLFRDGEPLLDKKLPDRVARLVDGGIKCVGISTNVSLLNEGRSRSLLEAGLQEITLSIDSTNKQNFETIRAGLNFEEVIENAIRFIELRDQMGASTQIIMRMIRQVENFDEWPEYERFWKPKLSQQDRCYFKNIHNWGGQLDNYATVAASDQQSLPCVALWSLMPIFTNGDVPLCNADFNYRHPLGNVLDSSIAELWQSKLANDRRQLHLEGQKGNIDICADCNIWDVPSDWENKPKTSAVS